MLIKIESYWCKGIPQLEDIKTAYTLTKESGSITEIKWYLKYSGYYSRVVDLKTVEEMTAEEYFEKVIPQMYAM